MAKKKKKEEEEAKGTPAPTPKPKEFTKEEATERRTEGEKTISIGGGKFRDAKEQAEYAKAEKERPKFQIDNKTFGTREEYETAKREFYIGQQQAPQKLKEEGASVEIPRGEDLVETTIDKMPTGEDIGYRERSAFGILTETPLGQAVIGNIGLEELKDKEKTQEIYSNLIDRMVTENLLPEEVTANPAMQALLKFDLSERDLKILNSGRADVSAMSQLIEGIGPLGVLAKPFTMVLGHTDPEERAQKVVDKAIKMGNQVRDYRMAAARNPSRAQEYYDLLEESKQEILDAQSTIKLLIIQSPDLQNSPELVDAWATDIDRSLTRIGDAQATIAGGGETPEQAALATQEI